MKLFRLAVCAACLGLLSVARADAPTPPAPEASTPVERPATGNDEGRWTRIVQVMSRVLDGSLPKANLATAVDDHAWIAPFAQNHAESARLLADRIPPSVRLVSVRSFVFPCATAAMDLTGDVERAGVVTPTILRRLKGEPGDDDLSHRAESSMTRWLASVLDATSGTPVGVIVLYDDGRRSDSDGKPTLCFVLIRGDFDVKGEPSVSRVLYGTMDAALR